MLASTVAVSPLRPRRGRQKGCLNKQKKHIKNEITLNIDDICINAHVFHILEYLNTEEQKYILDTIDSNKIRLN